MIKTRDAAQVDPHRTKAPRRDMTFGEQPSFDIPPPQQPAYQPAPPPLGPRTQRILDRQRRRASWAGIGFLTGLAALAIILGGSSMWIQHAGVPARLTVGVCDSPAHRSTSKTFFYFITGDCHGLDDQGQPVDFEGAHQKDVGHILDVHVMAGAAVVDGWKLPTVVFAVGCLLGVVTLIAIVRRLMR
jgi:hypothetical protein